MSAAAPPISPVQDEQRLATLHSLDLLDTAPEQEFDALVALAAQMLGCPMALLTLIDRDRQWIKAGTPNDIQNLPRDMAFCDHTIRGTTPMVIDDAAADARFAANPLTRSNTVRFYAGMPIHATDGDGHRQPVGALCVTDTTPRSLNDAGRAALLHLASLAEALIAARQTALEAVRLATASQQLSTDLVRHDRIFRQAERMARIGSWRYSIDDARLDWSEGVFAIYERPIGPTPSLDEAMAPFPPEAREVVQAEFERAIATGSSFDIEVDFCARPGQPRRVRSMAEADVVDGHTVAMVGVFQDITERHALELKLRHSADTDALTGIANRAAFDRQLARAMDRACSEERPLLLALIDLDGFKAINDTLGHSAGDDVLRRVGQVLTAPWLAGCTAARIGGDEFALIVEDTLLVHAPDQLARRLEEALQWQVTAKGLILVSAGTVGIAALGEDCHSARDFTHRADTILYAAKRSRTGERRRTERYRAAG
jgi:diguanylate cyclase (GGDEF)-like protein